jgi:uncharacterized protein involved in tellurium resistance
MRPSGKYQELWNENHWMNVTTEYMDQMPLIYMQKGDIYDSIMINMSQERFVHEIQYHQKDIVTPLTLNLRIVIKDAKKRVIEALTQEFSLIIEDDPEVVNKCADV